MNILLFTFTGWEDILWDDDQGAQNPWGVLVTVKTEQIHRDSTREAFVKQAWARLDEVRELEGKMQCRVDESSDAVQTEIKSCNIDVGMYISLAEVEIDLLEHADENEWAARRIRVDTAIGNAMGELERCDAILDRPPEHVQWK